MTLDQIDARFPSISINKLRDILDELHVDTKTGMHLQAINESGLILKDNENKSMEITCDTVVLSLGLRPRRDAVTLFKGLASDIFVIGDCNNEMGNLYKASSEGFFAAMDI